MIYWVQQGQIVELTADYVEHLFSYYVPDESLIIPDEAGSVDTSTYKYVIYDCATNPVTVNKPGLILSGLYNKPPTAQFFPFWALYMSHRADTNVNPKQYKVSCLNGTPWAHRKLTYLALAKKPYFNDIVFSFGNREGYIPLPYETILTDIEQQEFDQLEANVAYIDDDTTVGIDLSISHPAYSAYVNLVTETCVNPVTPMLSEKSFKPILANQLFVLIASPGAIGFLRSIGIAVFDDIIDHGYDTMQDIRVRINQALTQIDRLVQLDLESLFVQLQPRLVQNANYFKSREFRDQFKLNFG